MAKEMKLGAYLGQLRTAAGLSLREVERRSLALRLTKDGSISRSQLLHIESGNTRLPRLSKLVTLSQIYNVPLSDLTSFFEPEESSGRQSGENLSHVVSAIQEKLHRVKKEIDSPRVASANRAKYEDLFREFLRLSFLEEDAKDSRGGRTRALIPACDGCAPVSVTRARQLLYGLFPEYEDETTRRSIFRMLMRLQGEELKAVSSGFWGAYVELPTIQEELRQIGGLEGLQALIREKEQDEFTAPRSKKGSVVPTSKRSPRRAAS